jgi:uncharacterized membrane protein
MGATTGGISTLAFAMLFASNCAGFRNITEHWLQALHASFFAVGSPTMIRGA